MVDETGIDERMAQILVRIIIYFTIQGVSYWNGFFRTAENSFFVKTWSYFQENMKSKIIFNENNSNFFHFLIGQMKATYFLEKKLVRNISPHKHLSVIRKNPTFSISILIINMEFFIGLSYKM